MKRAWCHFLFYSFLIWVCIHGFYGVGSAETDPIKGFVSISVLKDFGFEVEVVLIGDTVHVMVYRDGRVIETGLERYVAFIDYREMIVLQRPSFERYGEIYIPERLLKTFELPHDVLEQIRDQTINRYRHNERIAQSIVPNPVATLILPETEGFPYTMEEERKDEDEGETDPTYEDDIRVIEFYTDQYDQIFVIVKTQAPLTVERVFPLSDPDRIVLDVRGLKVASNGIPIDIGHVKKLRIAQTDTELSRFVFDLSEPSGYIVDARSNEFMIYFLRDIPEFMFVSDGTSAQITLRNDPKDMPQFFFLSNPPRVVFDLLGYRWGKETEYLDLQSNLLKQIRISDFNADPATTRIVFEGKKPFVLDLSREANMSALTFVEGERFLLGKTIVVDAGHGGSDPGAIRHGIQEKDLTLAVALEFASLLRQNGATVVMTRSDDVFVPLYTRAAIANEHRADLFISIHANAHHRTDAHGFEVFYWHEHSKRAATIFERVIREDWNRASRGVKRNRYYVIRETNMPAILLELGFITNKNDRDLLMDPDFAKQQAEILLKAVIEYFGAS